MPAVQRGKLKEGIKLEEEWMTSRVIMYLRQYVLMAHATRDLIKVRHEVISWSAIKLHEVGSLIVDQECHVEVGLTPPITPWEVVAKIGSPTFGRRLL